MSRLISPGKQELLSRGSLNPGEWAVLELFDRHLAPEWEIYVQPHMNGLRPDFVLLHPKIGIAVFEVKDWNLSNDRYFVRMENSRPKLMVRPSDKPVRKVAENPFTKLDLYKKELSTLYCPRLESQQSFAVITAGLIFPRASAEQIARIRDPFAEFHPEWSEYERYYTFSSREMVQQGRIRDIFPESKRNWSKYMDPMIADDLRLWLREPHLEREKFRPLELDDRQRDIVKDPRQSGYRRIKGPAGSGKSQVLAGRAAEIASQGRRCLVVTYNITILNYLKEQCRRHKRGITRDEEKLTFLNFHAWAKRVCYETGHEGEYKELWNKQAPHAVLEESMAALVWRIYEDPEIEDRLPKYDAILVDEGQDFRPPWWNTLRKALEPEGEMLLVADMTQNIYERAKSWTDQAMIGCGFSGPWARLQTSYRVPPQVFPLLKAFVEMFYEDGDEADVPEIPAPDQQLDLADQFECRLRWVQTTPDRQQGVAMEELMKIATSLPEGKSGGAIADLNLLACIELGETLVEQLGEKGMKTAHTFSKNDRVSRQRKVAFYSSSSKIKATTLHSFKGLEARFLLLLVPPTDNKKDKALLYTALTRLRHHIGGSHLVVVSACPSLDEYGQMWPDYEKIEPQSQADMIPFI